MPDEEADGAAVRKVLLSAHFSGNSMNFERPKSKFNATSISMHDSTER